VSFESVRENLTALGKPFFGDRGSSGESLGVCFTLELYMTIDDRLDRLTARHEALTQSVEILVHQQREWVDKSLQWQQKNDQWWEKNQTMMAHVLESLDSLARIAQSHEHRLSDLEGGRG
jgi:hypothetical protein